MSDDSTECGSSTADDELVVRARVDRTAFALLYDRYYPRVARYCLRRLFDRDLAEDVTSEVFLNVASTLGRFPGRTETDFRRWLFRIATNAVLAYLRQSRRRRELWEAAARSRQGKQFGESPLSPAMFEMSDWPTIYQTLLELEERDQTIITLRFFAECSYDEIADVVESTPGAVRTALSRILTRLRERFAPGDLAVPVSTKPSKG